MATPAARMHAFWECFGKCAGNAEKPCRDRRSRLNVEPAWAANVRAGALRGEGRVTLKSRVAEPSEPASGKAGGEPARAPRFANSTGAFAARASHHLSISSSYHIVA